MHIALSQDWVSRLVPAPTCFYLSFMSVTILTMRTCMQEVISCNMYDPFTHGPSVVHSPPHRQSCTQAQSAFISRANACTRTMYGPTTTQTMPSTVYWPLARRIGFQHEQTRGGKAWYPTRSLVHTHCTLHMGRSGQKISDTRWVHWWAGRQGIHSVPEKCRIPFFFISFTSVLLYAL